MTTLDDRYRLLKCVALGGGIRTHNAQESSTGRPVMVHILDGAEPEMVERIQTQVAALAASDRSRILEISTADVGLVIVSEILSGLKSFPDWLGARASVPPPSPQAVPEAVAAPAPQAVPEAEPAKSQHANATESFAIGKIDSSDLKAPKAPQPPGEFTSLFQSHEAAAPQPKPIVPPPVQLTPPPAPAPAPVAAAPAPPASLKPGEFTSLFQPAAPAPQRASPSPVMGGAPPSAAKSPPPFQRASPPPPPPASASSSSVFAAPPPPPQPARPNEPAFGPLGSLGGPVLGSPAAPAAIPSPLAAAPAPPLSPLAEAPRSPLGSVGSGSAPLPPVIAPPVFTSPAGAGNAGAAGRSPLADQRAAGPSDYTMLIRQSATPAPPVAKPNAAAPSQLPATTRRSIPLGLIIALNVVLVLAIALVLYFVFRPAPPTAESGSTGALPTVPGAPTVKAPTVPAVKAPTVPAPVIPPAKP